MTQDKLGPAECTEAINGVCKEAFTASVGQQDGFGPADGSMTLAATGNTPAGATLEAAQEAAPVTNAIKLDLT